jgi:hypothetical protein
MNCQVPQECRGFMVDGSKNTRHDVNSTGAGTCCTPRMRAVVKENVGNAPGFQYYLRHRPTMLYQLERLLVTSRKLESVGSVACMGNTKECI